MRTYFWIGTAELEETKYRSDLTGKWESLLHFFFFFWLHHTACGILVPQLEIEPTPPALEGWSLNHWTIREVALIDSQIGR